MFEVLKTRWRQKYRTMAYPGGPPPELPDRFAGRPVVLAGQCAAECRLCAEICPTQAIETSIKSSSRSVQIDLGKCLFCQLCQQACPSGLIRFMGEYRLAAARREDLFIGAASPSIATADNQLARKYYKRSFKLRQVSAGGCNACEADCNVLGTLAWDMGRFGIQFVASPRHADALVVTGPVTRNMRLALEKTYNAVPAPRLVIAVGACAISGGLFSGNPEQCDGAAEVMPVDLFIPGCPPHPLTIFDGLLRMLGISE